MLTPALVALVFTFGISVRAAAYIGCFNRTVIDPFPSIQIPFDPAVTTCSTICLGYPVTYAIYWPQNSTPISEWICQCSQSSPNGNELHPAFFSEGCDFPWVSVDVVRPAGNFQWSGCWILPPGITPWTDVATFADCFDRCQSTPLAYAQYVGETAQCICTSSYPPVDLPLECGQNTPFLYYHDVIPSGFARRQAKRRLDEQIVLGQCPSGTTACNTAPDGQFFECLDTDTEIESCGGCAYGVFGKDPKKEKGGKGIDCTSLEGVRLGAVTCAAGSCVASACEDGYSVRNGSCIAQTRLQA
ncbi:hypothetical protein I302_105342 [Kwoniella bestiolae CBS 10118]|uniref:Protein CPL1-like domain-containing protein n=1 Tax=Kwoniella bestiolae CBS 10118 TaxID=1296100 RepID=A0A1B9FSV2_9TREE|nr:hypothetical protein I302_08628 [Kwoniella bestiolae CBS 10118]OCF21849.1 hypothetical protein I302_08628 [Kwoniella bestiolae CBS 10118]